MNKIVKQKRIFSGKNGNNLVIANNRFQLLAHLSKNRKFIHRDNVPTG